MIKILRIPKYGKTQYDKLFGFFYHIALSKYDKKNNQCWYPVAGVLVESTERLLKSPLAHTNPGPTVQIRIIS